MTVVEFFLRRHQYAVDKFLPKAQSILVIDGGTNLIFSTTPDIQCVCALISLIFTIRFYCIKYGGFF